MIRIPCFSRGKACWATQVQIALDKALGFIKQEVARERLLRIMPEFIFLPDTGLDRAAQLEKLFEEANIHKDVEEESEQ